MKKYRIRKVTVQHENGTSSFEYFLEKRVAFIFWDYVSFGRCYDLKDRWGVYPQTKMWFATNRDQMMKEYLNHYLKYYVNVKTKHAIVPVFYPEDGLRYIVVNKESFEWNFFDAYVSEFITKKEPMPFDQALKEYTEVVGNEVVRKSDTYIHNETL